MKIDKSWFIKPEGIKDRIVAGGIVIRKQNDKFLLLLTRGEHSDEYALPKGGVDKNEDILNGAKREIREETGITELKLIEKIGVTERLTFEKDFWSICHYYLFLTNQESGEQDLQEDEAFIVEWCDVDNLPKIFWPDQEKLVKENISKIKSV